jgi:exosortase/archaeosortase family protein
MHVCPIEKDVMDQGLQKTAQLAGWLLGLAGESCVVLGARISSERLNLNVAPYCSGVEMLIFYIAALLAFPSSAAGWLKKLAGIAAGGIFIGGANVVRVASLFLVGTHYPRGFDAMHTSVWSGLLIICTLGASAVWLQWVSMSWKTTAS